MNTKQKQQAKQDALSTLNVILKPNDRVFYRVNKVSRSGMSRRISFYAILDNDLLNLNYLFETVLDYNSNEDGVLIRGCGMDMGFHAISTISSTMFGDYKLLKSEGIA